MPKCLNCQQKRIKLHKTYDGNEPSPKGLGICAGCAEANEVAMGKDGQLWQALKRGASASWMPCGFKGTNCGHGTPPKPPSSPKPKPKPKREVIVIDDDEEDQKILKTRKKKNLPPTQREVIVIDDETPFLETQVKQPMLAEVYAKQDVRNWFLSEKMDGYRAKWDGVRMWKKSGKEFILPESFRRKLPKVIPLDGELWLGKKRLQNCAMFNKTVADDAEWEREGVKYMVFDLPIANVPFTQRYDILRGLRIWNDTIRLVEEVRVPGGSDDVNKHFKRIVRENGEGAVLRNPEAFYVEGRSQDLLKKKEALDSECEVIGYKMSKTSPDTLSSFKCRDVRSKSVFFLGVGLSENLRTHFKKDHGIGAFITYTYTDLTDDGLPRHARYNYLRKDNDITR